MTRKNSFGMTPHPSDELFHWRHFTRATSRVRDMAQTIEVRNAWDLLASVDETALRVLLAQAADKACGDEADAQAGEYI